MNEMWTALEFYQPFAKRHGFGAEWLKMTTECTPEAARAACRAAWAAVPAVPGAVWMAADAAREAAEAEAREAAEAIRYINEAIAEETK